MSPRAQTRVVVVTRAGRAEQRAASLAGAGRRVEALGDFGAERLAALAKRPPGALVVDMEGRAASGRDVALALRSRAGTRGVPLVLAGAPPGERASLEKLLPGAQLCAWGGVGAALERALAGGGGSAAKPAPVLAGYSGTPLPRKLGVKPGATLALVGAPEGFEEVLGELPEGARATRGGRARAERVVLFARSRADLRRGLPGSLRRVADGGHLWIAWPKQASGVATDLAQSDVRAAGLAAGWVDFKIAALDAVWSGLAFARRRSG